MENLNLSAVQTNKVDFCYFNLFENNRCNLIQLKPLLKLRYKFLINFDDNYRKTNHISFLTVLIRICIAECKSI